jgi:hypothetical protein
MALPGIVISHQTVPALFGIPFNAVFWRAAA